MWQLGRAPHLVNCTKTLVVYPFYPHLLLHSDLKISPKRELETLTKLQPPLKILLDENLSLNYLSSLYLPSFHPRPEPRGRRARTQQQQQQHARACCWLAARARPGEREMRAQEGESRIVEGV